MGDEADEAFVPAMPASTPEHPPTGPALRYLLGDDLADDVEVALEGYAPRAKEVGLPVLLLEGGRPWDLGNEWMRATYRGRDTSTREGCASDLVGFVRWCSYHGIDPLDIDVQTIEDFREARLELDGISGGTWNRQLSSICNFLAWNEERDGVKRLPASVSTLRVPMTSRPVEAVELDVYRRFRDVGLRGLTVGGTPDPDFPGRTGERNTLYADLTISTGLRRQESAWLLLMELPLAARGRERVHNVWLPSAITKREKPRQVHLMDSFLHQFHTFLEGEWLSIVEAGQREYRKRPSLQVEAIEEGRLQIDGRWERTDKIPGETRQRLVASGEVVHGLGIDVPGEWLVPLGLFPGTKQPMPKPESWTRVFKLADARVQAALANAGLPRQPRVRPHVLRHTYGVEFLRSAMRHLDERAVSQVMTGDERMIRRHFENPINDLRKILGHKSIDMTYRYLYALRRANPLESMPWTAWADELLSDAEGDDA